MSDFVLVSATDGVSYRVIDSDRIDVWAIRCPCGNLLLGWSDNDEDGQKIVDLMNGRPNPHGGSK